MKYCIIIPVHNEERTIGFLVETLKKVHNDIVVVDDGSNDRSRAIASDKGAVVVTNDLRLGKGKSLQIGFEYAMNASYDGVITLDGDGQHNPEDIGKFFPSGEDSSKIIIVGNRMTNHKSMPAIRFLTNRFMSLIISMICKQKIPDSQCGYRFVGSEILKNIKLACNGFEIESELLIKSSKKGYKIISVPIQTIYSDEESKINPIRDTVRFFKYLAKEMSGK